MVLKFYTSVAEVLKLRFRKFLGLIYMLVEVTGETVVEDTPCFPEKKITRSSRE